MVRLVSFQRRIASGSLRHPRRLPSRTGAPSARNGLRPRLVWIRRVEVDADLVVRVVLHAWHSRRVVSHVLFGRDVLVVRRSPSLASRYSS